jgi:hypothetical protein
MDEQQVEFSWGFVDSQDRTVERAALLDEPGGELRSIPEFSEPISLIILAGAVGIAYLAERLVKFAKDLRHNGLIVDCGPGGKLRIHEDPSVDRGQVLVLCPPPPRVIKVAANSELNILAALKAAAAAHL